MTHLAQRFQELKGDSPDALLNDLRIEPGDAEDFARLARFHYKGQRPGAITSLFRIVRHAPSVIGRYLCRGDDTQIIAVLVRSLPHLSCELRNLATQGRYRGLSLRESAMLLNREVRTITRVVVDPQWRGLGLAVRLVRHALQHPETGTIYTEALAAMGRVSPFFERAGMLRYDRALPAGDARLIDALRHVGIEPTLLASTTLVQQRLNERSPQERAFVELELRRWHRCTHRSSREGVQELSMQQLLMSARNDLFAQPVYYIFDHQRSGVSGHTHEPDG